MLTVKDVCQRLNVCQRTVYRLMKSGELTGRKIGRQWRFELRDLDKILAYKKPADYIIKPDLMSLKEVCEYLSLSRFTIYRLIKLHKLRALKDGGRWRFPRQDVKQFLTRNRDVPAHVLSMDFSGGLSACGHAQAGVMSLTQVAQSLGVGRQMVYRLVKEGRLPATKVGGVWRFIRTEVSRYMLDKQYSYGMIGVKGLFFWSQSLDKYNAQPEVYYVKDSAYDGFVGNRQNYHDYQTLRSIKALAPVLSGEGDRFFVELHYRKVSIKGGQILMLSHAQYSKLPTEEYAHWSKYILSESDLMHLKL